MLRFETTESVMSNFFLPSEAFMISELFFFNALERPLLMSYLKKEAQCFFSFKQVKLLFSQH